MCLRKLASTYPETASFPAGTSVAYTQEQTRSRNLLCEGDNRPTYGQKTRIDNKDCFLDDVFSHPLKEGRVVGNSMAWERGAGRPVSCRSTWTWTWTWTRLRGVSRRTISSPPYDVGAAFDRWR
jgi:hypothetical protein